MCACSFACVVVCFCCLIGCWFVCSGVDVFVFLRALCFLLVCVLIVFVLFCVCVYLCVCLFVCLLYR